ncbi:MAG: MFS transporter [Actinobacteria bacterium]|nr:MFS transporter [Actinomycetota bacterium]
MARVRLGADYWRLWVGSVVSNLGDGVGVIAYPWLASAATRDPILIGLIGAVQRLPWLVFTLPAGVLTDRLDRRRIMVVADVVRAVLVGAIAVAVLVSESGLPSPADLASGVDTATNWPIYLVLAAGAFLLGFAEVLRDNAAQTFLPAIVPADHLEAANGRMWGAEMAANSFVGPMLGSVLIAVGFSVPFFFDAGSFAAAAGLVFLITGQFRARGAAAGPPAERGAWRGEMKEGFLWLWHHDLLRPLAVILGLLNGLGAMVFSTFILFAQEDLDLETGLFSGVLGDLGRALGFESVGAFVFAVLMMAGAVGGILGSLLAPRISKALGSGPSLWTTMIAGAVTTVVIGISTRWWVAFLMNVVGVMTAIVWNVITVSLRQTIIPDRLLGRVNSVYRFFGWGMMPVGSLLGGIVVWVAGRATDRGMALRWPFFVVGGAYLLLLMYAAPRLTTARLDAARDEGRARREAEQAEAARDALPEAGIGGVPPDDPGEG